MRPRFLSGHALGDLDRWLARNYPWFQVTGFHKLVPIFAVLTVGASGLGYSTPGTMDRVTSTDNMTAALLALGLFGQLIWTLRQWRPRSTLPRGCKGALVWSTPVNVLTLGLFLLPAAGYSNANAAAIRKKMELAPTADALIDLAGSRTRTGPDTIMWALANGQDRGKWLTFDVCDSRSLDCLRRGYRLLFKDDILEDQRVLTTELCRADGMSAEDSRVWRHVRSLFRQDDLVEICKYQAEERVWTSSAAEPSPGQLKNRILSLFRRDALRPNERTADARAVRALQQLATGALDEKFRAAMNRATANLNNLTKAYGAHGKPVMRGLETACPTLAWTTLVGTLLMLAPYVRWQVIAGQLAASGGMLALIETLWSAIDARVYEQTRGMAQASLAAALLGLLVLRIVRVRRVRHEIIVTVCGFLPFQLLFGWSRWNPGDFLSPRRPLGLTVLWEAPPGILWLLGIVALYMLTPLALPILDRYRNLPEP